MYRQLLMTFIIFIIAMSIISIAKAEPNVFIVARAEYDVTVRFPNLLYAYYNGYNRGMAMISDPEAYYCEALKSVFVYSFHEQKAASVF